MQTWSQLVGVEPYRRELPHGCGPRGRGDCGSQAWGIEARTAPGWRPAIGGESVAGRILPARVRSGHAESQAGQAPGTRLESIDSDPSPGPAEQALGLVVAVCRVITDSLSLGARREGFRGGPARIAAAPSRRAQFEAEACAAALLPCT